VSVSATPERARADALREFVADQVQPLAMLHADLVRRWAPRVDVADARERLRAKRVAYDAATVVASVGPLLVPYTRAVAAMERAGLATPAEAAAARERRTQIPQLVAGWLSGEPQPRDRVRAIARRAVVLAASSVLRRATAEVYRGGVFDGWEGNVCPCCGGPAEFRLRGARAPVLICSRCDLAWYASSTGCLGCGATHLPSLAMIDAPDLGYRLAVCHPCARYIKEPTEPALIEPLVERALTAQLDAAAEARGLRL
jgi:hypothetical protein